MPLHLADTFIRSLGKLTNEEQKAVKLAVMELQLNPATPGLQFHRIDKSKDKNFWSARVNQDIRLVIHKTDASFTVCYVDHHDEAYDWAEKRRFETHPTTGAAQLVVVKEIIQERVAYSVQAKEPIVSHNEPEESVPLKYHQPEELLSYGIPSEWIEAIKSATVSELLEIAVSLPEEAGETIITLATGGIPQPRVVVEAPTEEEALAHPDAQRRFIPIETPEELEEWLNKPWDKWLDYLHAAQRELVMRTYEKPFRILGSAGTGKSLIALHRAEYLAKTDDSSRILVASYSSSLVQNLKYRLRRLAIGQPTILDRIDLLAIDAVAERLYRVNHGKLPSIIHKADLDRLILGQASTLDKSLKLAPAFVKAEWYEIVDAFSIQDLDAYKQHKRLGRKVALKPAQYEALWQVFSSIRTSLASAAQLTTPQLYYKTAAALNATSHLIYDHIIIDESQDLAPYHLTLLAAIAKQGRASMLFLGDDSQRVYQPLFLWSELGFDFKEQQHILRMNYRTGKAIMDYVEPLRDANLGAGYGLGPLSKQLLSKLDGHTPEVNLFDTEDDEVAGCASWLLSLGCKPGEVGLIVRSPDQLIQAKAVAATLEWKYRCLDEGQEQTLSAVTICTMPRSKGLEFAVVAILSCNEDVLPLESLYAEQGHFSDLQDFENMERYMLYVACTRTRDHLWVSGLRPGSIFLEDLG